MSNASISTLIKVAHDIKEDYRQLADGAECYFPSPETKEWVVEDIIGILDGLEDMGISTVGEFYGLGDWQQEVTHHYLTAKEATRNGTTWLCPTCNHRVQVKHSFCHWCGKRLKWEGR